MMAEGYEGAESIGSAKKEPIVEQKKRSIKGQSCTEWCKLQKKAKN